MAWKIHSPQNHIFLTILTWPAVLCPSCPSSLLPEHHGSLILRSVPWLWHHQLIQVGLPVILRLLLPWGHPPLFRLLLQRRFARYGVQSPVVSLTSLLTANWPSSLFTYWQVCSTLQLNGHWLILPCQLRYWPPALSLRVPSLLHPCTEWHPESCQSTHGLRAQVLLSTHHRSQPRSLLIYVNRSFPRPVSAAWYLNHTWTEAE